jgi:hypothetical protein
LLHQHGEKVPYDFLRLTGIPVSYFKTARLHVMRLCLSRMRWLENLMETPATNQIRSDYFPKVQVFGPDRSTLSSEHALACIVRRESILWPRQIKNQAQ